MDLFDERILTALKNGKPKDFTTLLNEVGFSHNTIQQYLSRLTAKGLVHREKPASKSFGRPEFAYFIPSRTVNQVNTALEDPQVEFVTIGFSHLRHVCTFEKGGYCKETRRDCAPQICPKIRK